MQGGVSIVQFVMGKTVQYTMRAHVGIRIQSPQSSLNGHVIQENVHPGEKGEKGVTQFQTKIEKSVIFGN